MFEIFDFLQCPMAPSNRVDLLLCGLIKVEEKPPISLSFFSGEAWLASTVQNPKRRQQKEAFES